MTQKNFRGPQRAKGDSKIRNVPPRSTYQMNPLFSSVYRLGGFRRRHAIDYLNRNMVLFDVYSFSVLAFVIEKETNRSVPIVTLAAGQAPDNFHVSSTEVETTTTYTYDSEAGPTTIDVDSRTIRIQVKRSRSAQALTMCLFLVNWALATGSIYIVLFTIFRREEINEAVLLFPVVTILIIPAPRSLYPGSPPFGIFIGKSLALRY